ncbi:hypothetical protein Taro_046909 [Colocasia esculenta]|uniref:Uncharacterized protein n=1 Tax=Colocasia esculenta TaxID=4460 RepID=A0A843X7N9_COLES|nr:hypothetical protein [Colocasia esculenta]
MQGLVQAMQTQAQTQAALQAQLQAYAQAPASVPQEQGHGGLSIMERFKRMAPPSFKGESQPLLAEIWMREVEKIFRAIRCAEEDKVSLVTYMLQVLRVYVLVLVAFDHRTLDEALSAACRQKSEMDQYMEEKRAAQKRSVPPFQREVPKVWQNRAPDQRLPQTSAVYAKRSANPNSGSSSGTSDREARKASGPSPSVCASS